MGKEGRQLSEKEARRAQVSGFVERVVADPSIVKVTRAITLPDTYKKAVIDTAVEVSFLSDKQIRKEAGKMDQWAKDSPHAEVKTWRPLLTLATEQESMINHYLEDKDPPLSENTKQEYINGLLKQRLIKRKVGKALLESESTQDWTKAALATNICIHAVNQVTCSK